MNNINIASTIGSEYSLDCKDDGYVIIDDFNVNMLSIMSIIMNKITYPNQPLCINLGKAVYDLDNQQKRTEMENRIKGLISSQIPGLSGIDISITQVKHNDEYKTSLMITLDKPSNVSFNSVIPGIEGLENMFNNSMKISIGLINDSTDYINVEY